MPADARTTALALLSRRDYTRAELERKLARKQFSAEDIQHAADALVADGWLNDQRAAAAHVRTALRVKGRGAHRIAQELEARGVSRQMAKELIAAEVSPEDAASALAAAVRRMRLPAKLDPATHRRAFQRLLRRGFSAGDIAKALGSTDKIVE